MEMCAMSTDGGVCGWWHTQVDGATRREVWRLLQELHHAVEVEAEVLLIPFLYTLHNVGREDVGLRSRWPSDVRRELCAGGIVVGEDGVGLEHRMLHREVAASPCPRDLFGRVMGSLLGGNEVCVGSQLPGLVVRLQSKAVGAAGRETVVVWYHQDGDRAAAGASAGCGGAADRERAVSHMALRLMRPGRVCMAAWYTRCSEEMGDALCVGYGGVFGEAQPWGVLKWARDRVVQCVRDGECVRGMMGSVCVLRD